MPISRPLKKPRDRQTNRIDTNDTDKSNENENVKIKNKSNNEIPIIPSVDEGTELKGNLIEVQVKHCENPVEALADTGAVKSCMSLELYTSIEKYVQLEKAVIPAPLYYYY